MQLAEEEMWINQDDEWLDYHSSEDEDDETEDDEKNPVDGVSKRKNGEEPSLNPDEVDPLYNDQQDDRDAKWVDENLSKYLPAGERHTDAILNCPCCFALLTIDCQRHESYLNQYRAMFVRNCKVITDKEVRYRKQQPLSKNQQKKEVNKQRKEQYQQKKLQKQKQQTMEQSSNGNSMQHQDNSSNLQQHRLDVMEAEQTTPTQAPVPTHSTGQPEQKPYQFVDRIMVEDDHLYEKEIYAPVHCAVCDTEVAVFDDEEIYHFFNVIPSEG